MRFDAEQITLWIKAAIPHSAAACSLCGRKIRAEEPCLKAIWRAQAGIYVQTFHPSCSQIVKTWGYLASFLTPKSAEKWAMNLSCKKCKDRLLCSKYVFTCEKAVNAIRLLGGAMQYEDREDE